MTESDFRNFNLLLRDETGNPESETMTISQLQAFLVRFGPLVQSIQRIRAFVNDGAAKWFHGNISREIAESHLHNFAQNQRCLTCFLIRSTPLQIGTYLPDTYYVFAVSYLKREPPSYEPVLLHTRLYINKQNQLCVPVQEGTSASVVYNPVHVPNFSTFLKNTLEIEETENCRPVPSDLFQLLAISEPIVQTVNCDVDKLETIRGDGYVHCLFGNGRLFLSQQASMKSEQ